MSYALGFFKECSLICEQIDFSAIDELAVHLSKLKASNGRLFLLGVGGSAANCSHAVNDFRKLCAIEAYAPTDNVSELTARTNDEGWSTVFSEWLRISRVGENDAVFVLSVGGGSIEKAVSLNIVEGVRFAKQKNAKVFGIVGRDGGYTAEVGDHVVKIPNVSDVRVTPLSEAFQAVVWHCLVSNPVLQCVDTKW